MTVQIITPASGTAILAVPWDGGTALFAAGELVAVPPGSALETAIGTQNLTPATGQQLASAANGSAGWVSN